MAAAGKRQPKFADTRVLCAGPRGWLRAQVGVRTLYTHGMALHAAAAAALLLALPAGTVNATAKQQCAYGTPNDGCPKGQHCWSGSCRCDCAAGPKAPCTMPPCAAPAPAPPAGKKEIAPGVFM